LGGIWGENSRKPVFGFRMPKEGLFCKGLNPTYATIKTECQSLNHAIQIYLNDFFLTSQP
ncbi:TPA: hypothetical protein ACFCHU_001982, partial [Neisseria gonorrhoeae]|nr:hypothetical protein [Neisseria gonorrhoeae]MCC9032433.1 hypothetical protein [Neisseria gonorrhoeae]MCC9038879.1 hypothetical protein [Neisseria gonorrhoeae]MCC9040877.1 hypothetical protein [Neisseria gonorrhoeae]MCC9046390.1 hypothetical protein [Neisseria gonorrhoeae]